MSAGSRGRAPGTLVSRTNLCAKSRFGGGGGGTPPLTRDFVTFSGLFKNKAESPRPFSLFFKVENPEDLRPGPRGGVGACAQIWGGPPPWGGQNDPMCNYPYIYIGV